jgi:hypothetical protein
VALRRVLPDTNVCFPISLLDLILRLDEAAFHEVVWTEDLLDELAAVWVAKGARSKASAQKVCDDIRTAFASQEVPRGDYGHLVDAMPGKDPADHPHAAAAVAVAPAVLLTANTADFPAAALAELGVTVLTPDAYLCALLEPHGDSLLEVVAEMAEDRREPAMTVDEVLNALERSGVSRLVAGLRALRRRA